MAKADIAALLALAAAVFIAIGNVVHQRSAHRVTGRVRGELGLFGRLLTDRRWWLGSAVAALGFGLQAVALAFGSVLLVQALLVTSLLFALPINARLNRRRVTAPTWTWAALLATSVVVIVTVGNPTAGQARATAHSWVVVIAVLVPVLAGCLLAARTAPDPVGAMLAAAVSGASWGVFAVLIKGVTARIGDGIPTLLETPELYAAVLIALLGTVVQQSAFRAGSLTASLPTMTVAEPVVAAILGVVVLGETMRPGDRGWLVLIAAIVVMVAATIALARGEAVRERPLAGAH